MSGKGSLATARVLLNIGDTTFADMADALALDGPLIVARSTEKLKRFEQVATV